jgi:hypothetical protein
MRRALVPLILAACGGGRGAAPVPTAEPAIAPVPYTAEQMRSAFPVGHELRFHVETPGAPAATMVWRVTAADDTTVTMTQQLTADDGSAGPVESRTTQWAELVSHAAFPAATTTLRDASIDLPAGHFETTEYVVRDGGDVRTFHFDKRRAGPPVSMVIESGGQVTRRMTLLSRN